MKGKDENDIGDPRFNHDGLLMQKLFVDPDFDTILLYSHRSKEILKMVKQDFMRVRC